MDSLEYMKRDEKKKKKKKKRKEKRKRTKDISLKIDDTLKNKKN